MTAAGAAKKMDVRPSENFQWNDAFLLDRQLTEDERLAPRVEQDWLMDEGKVHRK